MLFMILIIIAAAYNVNLSPFNASSVFYINILQRFKGLPTGRAVHQDGFLTNFVQGLFGLLHGLSNNNDPNVPNDAVEPNIANIEYQKISSHFLIPLILQIGLYISPFELHSWNFESGTWAILLFFLSLKWLFTVRARLNVPTKLFGLVNYNTDSDDGGLPAKGYTRGKERDIPSFALMFIMYTYGYFKKITHKNIGDGTHASLVILILLTLASSFIINRGLHSMEHWNIASLVLWLALIMGSGWGFGKVFGEKAHKKDTLSPSASTVEKCSRPGAQAFRCVVYGENEEKKSSE
jgi:hypothetical protein